MPPFSAGFLPYQFPDAAEKMTMKYPPASFFMVFAFFTSNAFALERAPHDRGVVHAEKTATDGSEKLQARFENALKISYPEESLQDDPVEEGRSLYPGSYDTPSASGNEILIDYAPGQGAADPDSAYGGLARIGTSEKNKITFKNGHVARFLFGGISLRGDVRENTLFFSGGTAADAAIGKLCGGQTKDGDVTGNIVILSGGQVGGDVYGGDADANGHAEKNQVEIRQGELWGFVNGGGVSGSGIARKNRVTISGGTVGMGVAGGFAHQTAGLSPESTKSVKESDEEKTNSVLENVVKISGTVEIKGNVSGGFILDSDGWADKNTIEISGGTIRGNVYGGRAFSGEANNNTIVISGGTIKDRDHDVHAAVYAGYVHKPDRGRATGNTISLSGEPDLNTITLYGNNLPTWKTDGNTLNFIGFRGTVRGFANFQDVNIDKDSCVRVIGEGPHDIANLNNKGRLIFTDLQEKK